MAIPPNLPPYFSVGAIPSPSPSQALLLAAQQNDLPRFREALAAGAFIDVKDGRDYNALHWAIYPWTRENSVL